MPKKSLKTYKELCTQFYDLELNNHPNTTKTLNFFMDYAINANGPILEPMCGTGRFLIPMLEKRLDIQGFDASPQMLNALKEKYAQISSKKPPVWEQFVEEFENKKLYNLIFVPFGSWGLITDIENSKKSLQKMYSHLAPGGKFVIEIETVSSLEKPYDIWRSCSHAIDDKSKITLYTIGSYNSQTQIFSSICRYEYFKEDKLEATENERFEQYLYHFDEMDKLLQNAGFAKINKYCDYSKSLAKKPNTPIIIYECIKE